MTTWDCSITKDWTWTCRKSSCQGLLKF